MLIQKCKEKYGSLLPYYQYQIMYDLQWRVRKNSELYLTLEENKKYIDLLKEILQEIDDRIIFEQRFISTEYLLITLALKYGEDIRGKLEYKNNEIYWKDNVVYKLAENKIIKLTKIKLHRKNVILYGTTSYYLIEKDYKIFVKANKKKLPINMYKTYKVKQSILGDLDNFKKFKVKIPIKSSTDISFLIDYKGNTTKLKYSISKVVKQKKKKLVLKKIRMKLVADDKKISIKKKKIFI